MFIVCYTRTDRDGYPTGDEYETYDDLKEAERRLRKLYKQASIYTASLCAVLKSTDYDPAKVEIVTMYLDEAREG